MTFSKEQKQQMAHGESPLTASQLFPELMDEVDKRIETGVQKGVAGLKIWILTSLTLYAFTLLAGVASITFYLGKLENQFAEQTKINAVQTDALVNRGKWITRKDDLDDHLIEYMVRTQGYAPPAWYHGRDVDSTGM